MTGLAWMDDALCLQVGPALFTLEQGEPAWPAIRICRMCPVVTECLAWALADPSLDGVLGGTTHLQRRRIRAVA